MNLSFWLFCHFFFVQTIQPHSASGVVSATIFQHLVSVLKREFCSKIRTSWHFFFLEEKGFFSPTVLDRCSVISCEQSCSSACWVNIDRASDSRPNLPQTVHPYDKTRHPQQQGKLHCFLFASGCTPERSAARDLIVIPDISLVLHH